MRSPVSSLRVRLALMVLLAVLPPLGLIVYTAAEWRRHEISEAEAKAIQLARHASAIHERLIEESRDVLFSLAQLSPVLQGEEARLREILLAFLREHPSLSNLGVIGPDGKISSSARPPADSIDVADRPFFRRAVETRKFATGDWEIDRLAGKGTVTFAYPVLGEAGRVQQVLFAAMDLVWVSELVMETLLPQGTVVAVFDEKGTIVAHEPDPAKWVGRSALQDPLVQTVLARKREGTARGTSLDSIPRLFAFRPLLGSSVPGTPYVSIGIPTAVAGAVADRILVRNLIGLGVAAALALVLGWVGSDLFLLRRVKALVSTTQRLSGGDMSARTGLPHGPGELNRLASAVDEMASALQKREQEIRRQTEELAGQERRFRALIENSSDGIVLIDTDWTLRYASPSTTRILGYAVGELIGHDLGEFIHPDDREDVKARLTEVVQRPAFVSVSFRLQHKNGSWRWIGSAVNNLLAEPGVQAIVANYRDITERKEAEDSLREAHAELDRRVQERTAELLKANEALRAEIGDRKRAEEALHESESRFRALLDSAAEGIYGVDLHGNCIFCNPACLRMLGFSDSHDLLGANMHALMHYARPDATPYPDEECRIYQSFRDVTGCHVDTEVFWRADGTCFPVEYWSYPLRRGEEVVGSVATFLDITDRKRAEAALSESRAMLAGILGSAMDAVISFDEEGRVILFNFSAERTFRRSAEEAIGQPIEWLTPEPLRRGFAEGLRAFARADVTDPRKARPWSMIGVRADGEEFSAEAAISRSEEAGQPIYTIILRDITERQRAEEALSESRTMLAGILGSAMDAIISFGEDQRIVLFNTAAEQIFRCSADEAIGQPIERLIAVPFRNKHRNGVGAFAPVDAANGRKARQWSMVALRANGEEFPVEASISQSEAAGESIYTMILRDITERQRAEEALRKLSRAIEQTGDSVFVTDRGGIIEYVNPSFEELTGFSRQEALGATPRILSSGKHDRRFYEKLWNTVLAGEVFRGVLTNKRKTGELYHEDETITPIRDSQGNISHFVSTGRDITRRIRTEEALRRLNDQLEHEATRIAGVLHDEAGQFLTSAHITLADVARDLGHPARERLQEVRRNLDQIEEQLRRLSHELRPRILDDMGLVDALKFLTDGVARRAGVPVSLDASLERRCPPIVETTLYRLVQEALTNMTKHARATRVAVVLKQEARSIHCSIVDDGLGFDPAAVLARRGESGLGLLGIQDRLEAVGGTLQIISAPGKGTELYTTIPLEA